MKKKGMLSNPFVVAGLGVIAVLFVYVQLVSPLLASSSKSKALEIPLTSTLVATSVPTEISPTTIIPTNEMITAPSAEFHRQPLTENAWRRQGKRDPFLLEPRSGKRAWWLTDSVNLTQTISKKKRIQVPNASKPLRDSIVPVTEMIPDSASMKSQLQAWTSGPSGSAAYVDGKIVRTGDALGATLIESIDNDTVVLRGLHGSQTLILAPGGSQ
jgi:hypothetical protein